MALHQPIRSMIALGDALKPRREVPECQAAGLGSSEYMARPRRRSRDDCRARFVYGPLDREGVIRAGRAV
jgi:hypothetical protein